MIQAWGWYIRLLGPSSLKNRHLINEMLKIPEQTFTDPDPQVQIASLVSWLTILRGHKDMNKRDFIIAMKCLYPGECRLLGSN